MTDVVTTRERKKVVREDFQIHPKLLLDVIQRQAGTLSKAVLELVMNAVDAKATCCKITVSLDPDGRVSIVEVNDDGCGFQSRESVDKWFKVFGQPHEESEGKVYGTFRLGRGQSFAFGRNLWRTGKFLMDVDVAKNGTKYDLTAGLPSVKGCRIINELYQPLSKTDLHDLRSDLQEWCKWAPIPIYFEDTLISSKPEDATTWQWITDDAYVSLTSAGTGLAVYNLGIHVMTVPSWKYGVSGTVVSRKKVKVNFARNDIQSDCEVWKVVREAINEFAGQKLVKKKVLNDGERQRVVDRVLTQATSVESILDARLITAVTGRNYSPTELDRVINSGRLITVAEKGSRIGDLVHRQEQAFVLAYDTLSRFRVNTLQELMCKLASLDIITGRPKLIDFDELTKDYNPSYEIVPEVKWTAKERVWQAILQKILERAHVFDRAKWSTTVFDCRNRHIHIGVADHAFAWTDAQNYIAFNRSHLAKTPLDADGIGKVVATLLHECCHTTPDTCDHDHDQGFYETYHDASKHLVAMTMSAVEWLPRALSGAKKELSKRQAKLKRTLDRTEAMVNDFHIEQQEAGEVEE